MSISSLVASGPARSIRATGAVLFVLFAAAGCQSTANGQPLLTDPAEIVLAGLHSTAALHTVHARLDMTFQAGGQGLGGAALNGRAAVDVDADLDTRSFVTRSVISGMGGPDQTSDMILVGGQQFQRNAPAARWTQFPQFGGPSTFPTNDQLVEAISSVVQGAGVDLQLADQEACGDATCYHVIANLDPATEWLLLSPLMGSAGPPPAGLSLPPITLNLLVDQATRALVSGNTSFSFQGTSAAITITLSNPDAEIVIAPPPPALVDQMGNNFGGGVLTTVGSEVAPVPAESVPPVTPEPMPAETP